MLSLSKVAFARALFFAEPVLVELSFIKLCLDDENMNKSYYATFNSNNAKLI